MIKENLEFCQHKIAEAAKKIQVSSKDITLVGVTKGVALPRIYEVIDAGLKHIGESRVQEAFLKYKSVNDYAQKATLRLTWHMIGHLQTNKVKEAVKIFDLIQSVDSVRLAEEIDKQAKAANKIQDVLLEVNASGETSKFGFRPKEVYKAINVIATLKNIIIRGLMIIAPLVGDSEKTRPYFRRLKELRDKIKCQLFPVDCQLDILSMGMTDDFTQAIEEGSTMIRIGRGIFGEREKT